MGGEMTLSIGEEPWDIILYHNDNDWGKKRNDRLRIHSSEDGHWVDVFMNNRLVWTSRMENVAVIEDVQGHLRSALRLLGG